MFSLFTASALLLNATAIPFEKATSSFFQSVCAWASASPATTPATPRSAASEVRSTLDKHAEGYALHLNERFIASMGVYFQKEREAVRASREPLSLWSLLTPNYDGYFD